MNRLIFFSVLFLATFNSIAQTLTVFNLKCEYRVDPAGVEVKEPKLSWELKADQRNVVQIAYQVLVADNESLLEKNIGNVWDSKQVNSASSILVPYRGKSLQTAKTYFWKVKVWDNKKNTSAWSKAARWQMGVLAASDWKGAKWIAFEQLPDSNRNILPVDGQKDKAEHNNVLPLLRKSFSVTKTVKKATMFISGLGHFEMSLNGKKIGDHFLDPGWTKYDKEAQYVTFDLTGQLKTGQNALGVMLGNGFYYIPPVKDRYRKLKVAFGYPKMVCRLLLEYNDGSLQDVISDNSWKTTKGPITFSSIYGGEDYDASLEQKGWDTAPFDDQAWKQALVVQGPLLISQMQEPLKIFENFSPKKISKSKSGNWVYDLGQNASGIIELRVKGKKGDTIKIIPAELMAEDGSVNQKATGTPYYFKYVLKGDGTEVWRPRFTYYGFRYLEVQGGIPENETNAKGLPQLMELKGLHIRNAAARSGQFVSSNDLFNRTNTLIDWAIKSNMASVFTDCPHREKLGWLEESHLMLNSVCYNYDVVNLCRKIIEDMKNSQTSDGLIPEIAPEYVKFEWGGDMFRDSPEWGSNSIIMPWYLYQWYGDKQVIEDSYPMMQRYVAYLQTKAKDNILSQGLGDWYDIGPKPPGVSQLTPMGVTGTAIYYYDLNILTKIAELLGKPQDAANYKKLAAEVKASFNKTFFNKETKQYATGSQAANAMAVYMKLVEPQYKDAVVENIVKDIRSRNNSLTAGDIGYRYLLKVLDDEGRSDVIFDMNSRSDVPGYGYQLAKGATALTESWQAYERVSNNHFMLGHLMEWFYSGLAGIRLADNGVAFNKIDIRPEPVGDVTSAKGTYQSPLGTILSEWKKQQNNFELTVQIPANATSIVYLPAAQENKITEGNKALSENSDIKLLRYEKGKALIQVGSGSYKFNVQQ